MASLGPSPPKRLKISPDLQPRPRPASPSKLPVRNGSNIRASAATKGPPLYSSAAKAGLGQTRRPPYAERAAAVPPKTNGTGDGMAIGKLTFGPTAQFRRAGGPRLEQGPARRSGFFESGLGEESESPPESAEDGKPSPGDVQGKVDTQSKVDIQSKVDTRSKVHTQTKVDTQNTKVHTQTKVDIQKGKAHTQTKVDTQNIQNKVHAQKKVDTAKPKDSRRDTTAEPAHKRQRPGSAEETPQTSTSNEALRQLVEARVNALRLEVDDLREQVQSEQARAEKAAAEAPKPDDGVEATIKRLLSANDASYTALPALAPPDPSIPSARPLAVSDPLPHLSAFHNLTFTSTSTTIYTTPAPLYPDDETTTLQLPDAPLTHIHTARGHAAARLLFFTLSFTVAHPTCVVGSVNYDLSPWARRELRAPLTRAAQEGDVNTLLYALSSYTELAKKRATVFSRLSKAFPHLLPVFAPVARGKGEGGTVGRRDIVPWLGTSLLRFHKREEKEPGGVELVVTWEIGVGVGGEAESRVEADVRVPGYWAEVDEARTFSKVGGTFRALVKERGVEEATRCVVGLVFQ